MENVNRVRYDKNDIVDVETDVSYMVKQTITQGLNDGGMLTFFIPADAQRFTDLNTILLRLTVSLVEADDSEPDFEEISVIMDPQGIHSLFSSVEVRFNDKVVSTMTSYPFTTALSRSLGCSTEVRVQAWDELNGTWECTELCSDMSAEEFDPQQKSLGRFIKTNSVLVGRIYSDVLMSSRQYLPPGTTLGINLRRAPDNFTLLSPNADKHYKAKIESASIYVKRLKLRPRIVERVSSSVKGITFNRLECRTMTIPAGSSSFSWLNCLTNAPLPNRLYVAFVSPSSYYGNITRIGTYFEAANLKSLNFKLNGRDLLIEPFNVHFKKGPNKKLKLIESDGRHGYLSVLEVLNQVSDQSGTVALSYDSYMRGKTFYCIELGKCGEKIGSSGGLDVELEFGTNGADMELCMLLFSEKTQTALI